MTVERANVKASLITRIVPHVTLYFPTRSSSHPILENDIADADASGAFQTTSYIIQTLKKNGTNTEQDENRIRLGGAGMYVHHTYLRIIYHAYICSFKPDRGKLLVSLGQFGTSGTAVGNGDRLCSGQSTKIRNSSKLVTK